jgi:16S rRNA (guanine966-N2)-methyltransferase
MQPVSARGRFGVRVGLEQNERVPSPSMRVVAGSLRGRKLVTPEGLKVRPTAERVRQATLNALEARSAVDGARVVDLFAGSGALAIEALSRGAIHATFVEQDRDALVCIRKNLEHLALGPSVTTVTRSEVVSWARHGMPACDLVFIDPPYPFDDWVTLLELIRPALVRENPDLRGIVVAETAGVLDMGPRWEILRQQRYGGTVVTLAVPTIDEPGDGIDDGLGNAAAVEGLDGGPEAEG